MRPGSGEQIHQKVPILKIRLTCVYLPSNSRKNIENSVKLQVILIKIFELSSYKGRIPKEVRNFQLVKF